MIIILPCSWCPVKYVISHEHIVKGTGLDPVSAVMPGLAAYDVPQGSAAGI